MPEHEFRLTAIAQTLENDAHLAEALFFPEVSCHGDDLASLYDALRVSARRLTESLPPGELHRRHAAGAPEVVAVTLDLAPPAHSPAWRDPLRLTFPAVRWAHGDDAHVAFVPALGIEVLAEDGAELERRLPEHIRAALLRTRAADSLAALVWLQRCRELRVEPLTFTATVPTPRQRAVQAQEDEVRRTSVLAEVGSDLTAAVVEEAHELDEVVGRLAEALTGRSPRSVLLVGPSGVGKTAAVRELVRCRDRFGLGPTPFWATSGSRLIAGMSGFGTWEARCQALWREAARRRAVLHLGNLVELLEVGRSESRGQGVASFLRPYLGRGDLLAVAECTPEQLPLIERQDPHLLGVFVQVQVEEPDPQRGRTILLRCAAASGGGIGPEALAALDRLHRRYATYSAYPGRPLRFLRNLLHDPLASGGRQPPEGPTSQRADAPRSPGAITAADVTRAFSRETGLPLVLLDESAGLDLKETEKWFARRVVGQPEAVGLIVDLLATVKAGLTRPRRPIASLLFVGPTGVGKTETARALAEFLFGDARRLTRLDMSEYADPAAVQRLIGGPGGEGVLTARVREQPFAVVLLDEFEKAHPLFFDLLLQMLGEGRLTDASGRLADFSNAVVILTSNLGAGSFQQGPIGFVKNADARRAARAHFAEAVRDFVRPELYGRIDRIVSFAPLDEDTTLHIARRQLELLGQRDGVRYRAVNLDIAPEVARYLARKGYDPRYGARPLKRAVERELLAPLADRMNQYSADAALDVQVGVEGDRLRFHVLVRTDAAADVSAANMAADCVELRRGLQRLRQSPAALEVVNEVALIGHLEQRGAGTAQKTPEPLVPLARLAKLRRITAVLEDLHRQACDLEDRALLALHGAAAADDAVRAELAAAGEKWTELLLHLYYLRFPVLDTATLAVYSESRSRLCEFAAAYHAVAAEGGAQVSIWQLLPPRPGDATAALERRPVPRPAEFFAVPPEGLLGVALDLHGPNVFPRIEPEQGVHAVVARHPTRCLVDVSPKPFAAYAPPRGIHRRGSIPGGPKRREYNWQQGVVADPALGQKFPGSAKTLKDVLARAVEQRLLHNARALVEP